METTPNDLIDEHNHTAKNLVDYIWNHPASKAKSLPDRVIIFLVVCVVLPVKTVEDIIQNFRKK